VERQQAGQQEFAGARVLLAEADPLFQEIALELLAQAGLDAVLVTSGAAAVAEARRVPHDLLLCAQELAGREDAELARQVASLRAAAGPGPRLVALTTDEEEGPARCLAAGFDDVLPKPLDPDRLPALLARWLAPRTTAPTRQRDDAWPAGLAPWIEVDEGLRHVAGNQRLYRELLQRFAARHADGGRRLLEALRLPAADAARRELHTLKGAAATLGARRVATAAAALERALDDEAADRVALDATLGAELTAAVTALTSRQALLPASPATPAPPGELADLATGLRRLLPGLDQQRVRAVRAALAELEPRPWPAPWPDEVRWLGSLIRKYQYPAAQAHVQSLLARLPATTSAPAGEPAPGGGATASTVLLVDDTAENLELLVETLGDEHELLAALDGEAALRLAREALPDLVLLDVMMPGLDGYEVCRRLRDDPLTGEVPVIFLTALADGDHEGRGLALGAVDYVSKPFDPTLVRARVRNQVQLQRSRLELARQRDASRDALAALQQAEQLRDDLVQMVAHDLRSPLMSISGSLQLALLEQPTLQPAVAELLEQALTASGRLNELISSFLDVSRLEEGRLPVELSELDLRDCVHAAQRQLGGLLVGRRVQLRLPAHPVLLRADQALSERIVQNLLGNALKFTPHEGLIQVELVEEPGWAHLTVRDDGPGIPESHHHLIFEKFGQVEARREGRRSSTGLGLTFCKLATVAQGGSIEVESRPGEGAAFHVRWPRTAGTPLTPADAPAAGPGLTPEEEQRLRERPLRLLLLDEDRAFAASLRRYLGQHTRWTLLPADTLERALRVAREHSPALLLVCEDTCPGSSPESARLLSGNPATRHLPRLAYRRRAPPPPPGQRSAPPQVLTRAAPLACFLEEILAALGRPAAPPP
jgi:signal transduction histidine kinase/HPt (histidine-containing phosphotransfer) domain-containing protein